MLTPEVMGLFALGVMWLSTALVVAVAIDDAFRARRKPVAIAVAFTAGAVILGAATGITWLALTPPVFGPISTLGGAMGLAYFLLVQPAGVMLRRRLHAEAGAAEPAGNPGSRT